MMVALTVPNFRELVICPDSEIEIIRRQAKSLTLESVLSCMDRIGDAIVAIKGEPTDAQVPKWLLSD